MVVDVSSDVPRDARRRCVALDATGYIPLVPFFRSLPFGPVPVGTAAHHWIVKCSRLLDDPGRVHTYTHCESQLLYGAHPAGLRAYNGL